MTLRNAATAHVAEASAPLFSDVIVKKYLYPVLEMIVPVAVGTIILSVIVAFIGARIIRKPFGEVLLFVSPLAWLGGICGLIAGASQEPLVGALLTGMLTLITAMLSYLLSKDTLAEWRLQIQVAIILLCVTAVVGLTFGRIHKARSDSFEREYAVWRFELDNEIVPARAARARHDLCRARIGLTNAAKCDAWLLPK